jgi:hypothetical protein
MNRCSGLVVFLVLMSSPIAARERGHHGHHGNHGAQDHAAETVAVEPAVGPRLRLELATLDAGRHELRLATDNFRFVPDDDTSSRVIGEGHAHLYIDGVKIGRVYGETHSLPALSSGAHDIFVELVTADHAVYSVAGAPVAARVVLRVGDRRDARHVPRRMRDFAVSVVGGAVPHEQRRPRTLRATLGETVRIQWQSDAAVNLHLHGYDLEAKVDPGVPVTMQFDADIAGRFSIASHGDGRRGGHAHRGLLYLEVHPK